MAFSRGPKIVTDGLVLALDAANPRSYPGSGTTWYDLSGNGNNAVSQANAATTEGRFNSGGFFDLDEASNVYFLISGLNNYNFNPEFSISFWIKNTGGDYRAIFQNSDNVSSDSDSIDIRLGREDYYGGSDNGTRCQFKLNDSSNSRVIFSIPLNIWTNVHCSYDGTEMRVCTNGVEFDTRSTSITVFQKTNDVKLFRHYNSSEDLVNPFASIKLYNRALTAQEVLQNYNANKGRFGL